MLPLSDFDSVFLVNSKVDLKKIRKDWKKIMGITVKVWQCFYVCVDITGSLGGCVSHKY